MSSLQEASLVLDEMKRRKKSKKHQLRPLASPVRLRASVTLSGGFQTSSMPELELDQMMEESKVERGRGPMLRGSGSVTSLRSGGIPPSIVGPGRSMGAGSTLMGSVSSLGERVAPPQLSESHLPASRTGRRSTGALSGQPSTAAQRALAASMGRGRGERTGATSRPIVHMNATHMRQTLAPAEAKVAMLEEWEASLRAERRAEAEMRPSKVATPFASLALSLELQLRRASLFTKQAGGPPSELQAAVAMDALERLGGLFGRFQPLVRLVQEALLPSLYLEAADPEVVRSTLDGVGEEEGVVRYSRLTAHFADGDRLREERAALRAAVEHLRATLLSWEEARASDEEVRSRRGKIVQRWQSVLQRHRHENKVQSIAGEVERHQLEAQRLRMAAENVGTPAGAAATIAELESPAERVSAIVQAVELASLDDKQSLTLLRQVLQAIDTQTIVDALAAIVEQRAGEEGGKAFVVSLGTRLVRAVGRAMPEAQKRRRLYLGDSVQHVDEFGEDDEEEEQEEEKDTAVWEGGAGVTEFGLKLQNNLLAEMARQSNDPTAALPAMLSIVGGGETSVTEASATLALGGEGRESKRKKEGGGGGGGASVNGAAPPPPPRSKLRRHKSGHADDLIASGEFHKELEVGGEDEEGGMDRGEEGGGGGVAVMGMVLGRTASVRRVRSTAHKALVRAAAVRFLCGIDTVPLEPGPLRMHLEGEAVPGVRVLRPGDLASSLLGALHREEQIKLLRDVLDVLRGAALPSVLTATLSVGGPLHGAVVALPMPRKAQLLRMLLASAPHSADAIDQLASANLLDEEGRVDEASAVRCLLQLALLDPKQHQHQHRSTPRKDDTPEKDTDETSSSKKQPPPPPSSSQDPVSEMLARAVANVGVHELQRRGIDVAEATGMRLTGAGEADDAEGGGKGSKRRSRKDGEGDDGDEKGGGKGQRKSDKRRAKRVIPDEIAAMPESMAKFAAPWRKYMGAPPRGMRWKRLDMRNALSIVQDAFEKKIREDANDDMRGETRQTFPDYVRDYLLQRFGLPSLAEGTLFSLAEAIDKYGDRSRRLRRFGKMVGLYDPMSYSPRYGSAVLAILRQLFPGRKLASTLRSRREGRCFVPLTAATAAARFVLSDRHVSADTERIRVSDARRQGVDTALAHFSRTLQEALDSIEYTDPGTPSHARPRATATKSSPPDAVIKTLSAGMAPSETVVELEDVLDSIMEAWENQRRRDDELLVVLYDQYDYDKNGVLSFNEFRDIINACVDPTDDHASKILSERTLLHMFTEVVAMDPREALPPAVDDDDQDRDEDDDHRDDDDDDDDDEEIERRETNSPGSPTLSRTMTGLSSVKGTESMDAVSPEAFRRMCDTYGIVPYRKTARQNAEETPERTRSDSVYKGRHVIGVGIDDEERRSLTGRPKTFSEDLDATTN